MTPDHQSGLQSKVDIMRRDAEERDTQRKASRAGIAYVDLRKTPISMEAVKMIPFDQAKKGALAPIQATLHEIGIAAYDPDNEVLKEVVRHLEEKHFKVKLFIASGASIKEAWRFYKYVSVAPKEITGTVQFTAAKANALKKKFATFNALQETFNSFDFVHTQTIEFIELLLIGALVSRASDIHLEAGERSGKVRLRVDGILHDAFDAIPLANYEHVVSRLKLIADLKINVRDEAQDGRFSIQAGDQPEIEVRVSVIPSDFGETVVMRLLDPASLTVGLAELGLRDDDLTLVQAEIARPNGLLLNTGPTGSGKTTTLYAFLKYISKPEVKVITIEDPIEYRLAGIEQTQIDADSGYTFASGLRSILRQDPNVVLVGEIRDEETADIAIQASLTGHLVFSTLHTNDAIGAISRLVDLKVRSAIIGSSLNMVIAQRLVRRLCDHCKKRIEASPLFQQYIRDLFPLMPARISKEPYAHLRITEGDPIYYFEPQGCAECNGFGYRGRVAVFEFLRITPELGEAVSQGATELALRTIAKSQDFFSMQQDAALKILLGVTSLAELEKVTGPLVLPDTKK